MNEFFVSIALDEGALTPTYAHNTDAGMDIYSPVDVVIPKRGHVFIDTGVHIAIPRGCVGYVKSKSGLMKKGIVTDGTIDSTYTGSIGAVLFNHSDEDYEVMKGDKIIQLVIQPYHHAQLVIREHLFATGRGDAGFGSTGR